VVVDDATEFRRQPIVDGLCQLEKSEIAVSATIKLLDDWKSTSDRFRLPFEGLWSDVWGVQMEKVVEDCSGAFGLNSAPALVL
jgi:hypothetical protein